MSSTYQAICLSHDPAIEISGDYDEESYTETRHRR